MDIRPVRCRIPDILDKKRKTQVWLADQMGISRQTLNGYVHLRSIMGMEIGAKVAAILGVKLDDLYEWERHGE